MFKRNKVLVSSIVIFLIILLMYFLLQYFFFFSRQIVVAELLQIESNNLTFQPIQGEQFSVRAPELLVPLLKTDQRYFVVIYRNQFRKPFIKEIKEVQS